MERKKTKQINITRKFPMQKKARQFHITGKQDVVQHANQYHEVSKGTLSSIQECRIQQKI